MREFTELLERLRKAQYSAVRWIKPLPFADRIRVLLLCLGSYFAVLSPWALMGSVAFWRGCILFAGSLPVLALGVVLVPLLAGSIVERPFLWAILGASCSTLLSLVGFAVLTGGSWVGLASLVVAIPAAGVFAAVAWWRPLWWPTDRV